MFKKLLSTRSLCVSAVIAALYAALTLLLALHRLSRTGLLGTRRTDDVGRQAHGLLGHILARTADDLADGRLLGGFRLGLFCGSLFGSGLFSSSLLGFKLFNSVGHVLLHRLHSCADKLVIGYIYLIDACYFTCNAIDLFKMRIVCIVKRGLEIFNSFAELQCIIALNTDLCSEIGKDLITVGLGGAQNEIGTLVCLVDKSCTCSLCVDDRVSDRFLVLFELIVLRLYLSKAAFKRIIFAIELGILGHNEV